MNRKLILFLIFGYTLVFSVLKTIRFPNDWAEAHWILDYRFGLIKRGLAGEIFGFFADKNEDNITALSIVILTLLYCLLLSVVVKIFNASKSVNIHDLFFCILFCLSQYIVFSAHLIGYLDHIIFLIAFLAVFLIKRKLVFAASVLISAAIFIHEISAFLILPVCTFCVIVREFRKDNFKFKEVFNTELIKKLGFFLFLPLVSIMLISSLQEMHNTVNFQTIFAYLKNTGLVNAGSADSVSSAYTKEFSYYFEDESPFFLQRVFISTCTIFCGIPLTMMFFLMYQKFQKINLFIILILGICSLTPLLLHSIAYDTYRIWSFPFMILFMGYWILSSEFAGQTSAVKASTISIIGFIICFFMLGLYSNPLMDGETERFSISQRICLLIPLLCLIFLYLKSPRKNLEAC